MFVDGTKCFVIALHRTRSRPLPFLHLRFLPMRCVSLNLPIAHTLSLSLQACVLSKGSLSLCMRCPSLPDFSRHSGVRSLMPCHANAEHTCRGLLVATPVLSHADVLGHCLSVIYVFNRVWVIVYMTSRHAGHALQNIYCRFVSRGFDVTGRLAVFAWALLRVVFVVAKAKCVVSVVYEWQSSMV